MMVLLLCFVVANTVIDSFILIKLIAVQDMMYRIYSRLNALYLGR